MRIAWFTPFHPKSSIGHYSEEIVSRLAARHEVTVFAPAEVNGAGPRPFHVPVVGLPQGVPPANVLGWLDGYDVAAYNLGNHCPNHVGAYEAAVRKPGIVILHDVVLRDLFLEYLYTYRGGLGDFPRWLRRYHGPEAEAHGRDVIEGRRLEHVDDPDRLRFPLFAPALHRALGVVVHSDYARGRVAEACPGPVRVIDFPFHGPSVEYVSNPPVRRPSDDGKARVLTFGVLHSNKVIHATVRAIGESKVLRERVTFTVIGEGNPDYRARLERMVAEYRLEGSVTLAGWRSDEDLRDALGAADVVVNLRNPHCGESSGTLLNALLAGAPTVVWDHGFYGEFPDGVVVKIRAEAELPWVLERLVRDAGLRERVGLAARAHALERFDTDRYCREFEQFAEELRGRKPAVALADRAADVLAEVGAGPLDGLAARVGAEIATFLRPRDEAAEQPGPVPRSLRLAG